MFHIHDDNLAPAASQPSPAASLQEQRSRSQNVPPAPQGQTAHKQNQTIPRTAAPALVSPPVFRQRPAAAAPALVRSPEMACEDWEKPVDRGEEGGGELFRSMSNEGR